MWIIWNRSFHGFLVPPSSLLETTFLNWGDLVLDRLLLLFLCRWRSSDSEEEWRRWRDDRLLLCGGCLLRWCLLSLLSGEDSDDDDLEYLRLWRWLRFLSSRLSRSLEWCLLCSLLLDLGLCSDDFLTGESFLLTISSGMARRASMMTEFGGGNSPENPLILSSYFWACWIYSIFLCFSSNFS